MQEPHTKTIEKPWKQWLFERSNELGIDPGCLRMRIVRKKEDMPKIRRVGRLMFVQIIQPTP